MNTWAHLKLHLFDLLIKPSSHFLQILSVLGSEKCKRCHFKAYLRNFLLSILNYWVYVVSLLVIVVTVACLWIFLQRKNLGFYRPECTLSVIYKFLIFWDLVSVYSERQSSIQTFTIIFCSFFDWGLIMLASKPWRIGGIHVCWERLAQV